MTRAENDLATLRDAARGEETWPKQLAAMQETARQLHERAQFENRVVRGVAQYDAQKQAHKADDSDPETSGAEDDGADDHYYGLDEAAVAKMVEAIPPQRAQPPPPAMRTTPMCSLLSSVRSTRNQRHSRLFYARTPIRN